MTGKHTPQDQRVPLVAVAVDGVPEEDVAVAVVDVSVADVPA
jgi:hypothetical protein